MQEKKRRISRILAVVFAAVMAACFVPQTSAPIYAVGRPHEHDGITFQAWDKTDSLPSESGSYYLTDDVTIDDSWTIENDGTINLCLNGHRIANSSTDVLIYVDSNSALNVYDCQGSGSISTIVTFVYQEAVLVWGTLNLYGGTIGGVYLCDGTFNMYGGSISESTARNGSGVDVASGTFNMSGGTISDNSSYAAGGGVFVGSGTFNMSGGSITNNSAATAGGGVYQKDSNSTVRLSGSPLITGNTVNDNPNNLQPAGAVKITGALNTPEGATAPQIGVTMTNPGVFTSGLSGKIPAGKKASDLFFSDDDAYVIVETEAKEAATAKTYTVTLDDQGATAPGAASVTATYNEVLPSISDLPMKTGSVFDGYFSEPNGGGTQYLKADGTPTEEKWTTDDDGTLYAKWVPAYDKKKTKISMDAGLKGTSSKGRVIAAWGKAKDADYYDVYAAYCKGNSKFKKIKTVNGKVHKLVIKKLGGKKLNPKRNVKYYVVAYKKAGGKKVKLATSLSAYVAGSANKNFCNVKSIHVTKKAFTLKKKKTTKIKAKLVPSKKGKKTLSYVRKFRYATDNERIAKVSKKGTIKAVGKGKCNIYVYAQNGCAKKIRVTVK